MKQRVLTGLIFLRDNKKKAVKTATPKRTINVVIIAERFMTNPSNQQLRL